jgi:hypothetical protein
MYWVIIKPVLQGLLVIGFQGMKDQVACILDFQEGVYNCHLKCIFLRGQKCIGHKLQLFTSQLRHRKGLIARCINPIQCI